MIATNNGSFPWTDGDPSEDLDSLRQDRFTREAIDAQVEAGLDLVTDGLVRRRDPVSYVTAHLAGITLGEAREGFPGSGAVYRVPVVEGEVAWTRPILSEDFLFASQGCARPLKPVLTGPYTLAQVAEDRVYGDRMALAMGLATALNQELRSLQAAGATFIQVDEPALLKAKDEFPLFTRIWEVFGRGVSATLCLHLEGGDPHGLYPGLARLKRLGCLSLDCVEGKTTLDVLASSPLPENLRLGLGVVDGRTGSIEDPEEIAARLRSVRGLPPDDRIFLGPASDLGRLTRGEASAKLRAVARAARLLERG
jgi:5-methyltetrahydropteroyltriglutamate--homocysteine methyltransferase